MIAARLVITHTASGRVILDETTPADLDELAVIEKALLIMGDEYLIRFELDPPLVVVAAPEPDYDEA